MAYHLLRQSLFACLLTLTAHATASAQASAFTSLQPSACKGAPGNVAAQKHDHAAMIYTCSGAAGWRIKLTYFGANVSAEFTKGSAAKPAFTLRADYDIGPRIEWRSRARGEFPYAAIVRLHVRTDTQKTASALAVLGLTHSSLCLAAIVDPSAAGNANVTAQAIADRLQGATCEPDALRLKGDESEIVRELIEMNQ
jgi:hypothetical protein